MIGFHYTLLCHDQAMAEGEAVVLRSIGLICGALIAIGAFGCSGKGQQEKMSNLTPGMVTLSVSKGNTTQADILETFGPPDQVTHRDDLQIWTYDKISYSARVDSGSLIFYSASTRTSSSVSTMLILYFNEHDIVQEYRFDSYRF